MSNVRQTKSEQMPVEAASWIAQIDAGPLSPEDKLALSEWLSRSPSHVSELRRYSGLWSNIDHVIDDALLQPKATTSYRGLASAWISIRPFSALGSVICVVVVVALGLFSSLFNPSDSTLPHDILSAAKGEMLVKTLSDGTVVRLNTNSIAKVDYSERSRTVRLVRGEALFEVVKDTTRPFEVYAGNARIEAVGTAFLIRMNDEEMAVTVTEGKIRLDSIVNPAAGIIDRMVKEEERPDDTVYLVAGETTVVNTEIQSIDALDTDEIGRHTAWTKGDLVFAGDTLAYVADELSRYNSVTISMDHELRGERMGGRFKTTDVDRILEALELSMDIKVHRAKNGGIFLSKK